jgi:AcrR family transcriptional regulator
MEDQMTGTADRSRADETRERLLEAAVAAFAERGFHGTTTRDIASAAGMSPAAVYVHHKSKEELLHLISRTGHERTLHLVRTAIASESDPAGQLAAVVRTFAVHHARAHTSARIVNYELAALSDDALREIKQLRRAINGEIRALVERGVQAGAFDTPNPSMAATALLSLGIDIGRWYRDEGAWSPEEIGDFYADLALRMVGGRPTA